MLKIIHRINTIKELREIPENYGVEIDIRGYGDQLLLSHDPIEQSKLDQYDNLEKYLENYSHSLVVFNLKEAGYERRIAELVEKHGITEYFLLDVEFPYLYSATRSGKNRKIAARYSEAEPIESVEAQILDDKPLLDWVWIDTNTVLPLDIESVKRLKPFKTCLVSPDRWGRPEDIEPYIAKMKDLSFELDAVMVGKEHVNKW